MRNEDIKCWMDLHTKAIKGEIKAAGDMLDLRIDGLEEKIDNNHTVVDKLKKETFVISLMYNHPKKTLFIVILIICGFIFLSNNVEFRDLLFFIKR